MLHALSDCAIVGRQSVRDRDMTVVGYELLTSVVDPSWPLADDAPPLSADPVALSDAAVNLLTGDRPAFLTADRALLTGETLSSAAPGRLVVVVGEAFNADPDAVAGCQKLAAQGIPIALAGFPWRHPDEALLAAASIVKIDTSAVPRGELPALVADLRRFEVQVLAGNVDTPDDLAQVRALDIDLFQGYALQHVISEPRSDAGASEMTLARMSSALLNNPLDFDQIEEMLRTEPGLTYQIIELASVGKLREAARQVTSLRRALVLVGSWRIQNWMMMLLAQPRASSSNGAITSVLARARASEVLAESLGRGEARLAFTGGMISSFEELTQVPRAELEQTLALADDLRDAAFGADTALGRIVSDVADRQDGRAHARLLSGRSTPEIDAALAAGYEWAVRASSVLA